MPNGGPDNCGTCGFNRRNRGIWRNPEPDETQTSFCEIRNVAILADHWTYCQNWHTHTCSPIGPIYSSGAYEDIDGFPGTDWLRQSLSKAACAASVAHPLTMGSL
jgi:hypothetical protein